MTVYVDPYRDVCLACTLDDCVTCKRAACPLYGVKRVVETHAYSEVCSAIPFPAALLPPQVEPSRRGCHHCQYVVECHVRVSDGCPALCERVGYEIVGCVVVRV